MKQLILYLLTFSMIFAQAPRVSDRADSLFSKELYISGQNDTLQYRLLSPQDPKEGKEYPLVLFLHGSGERGSDNHRQLIWGADMFVTKRNLRKFPAYVIAPQCPEDLRWVEVHWALETHRLPEQPSKTMALVMELLDEFQEDYHVDAHRIYVTGLSMGGYGTWDLIARIPDHIAAAAPICGGGDETQAEKLADMPIWVFHGKQDPVVPVYRSRNMVEAVKKAGSRKIKYTEYPETGHGAWKPAYANRRLLRWMFRQRNK